MAEGLGARLRNPPRLIWTVGRPSSPATPTPSSLTPIGNPQRNTFNHGRPTPSSPATPTPSSLTPIGDPQRNTRRQDPRKSVTYVSGLTVTHVPGRSNTFNHGRPTPSSLTPIGDLPEDYSADLRRNGPEGESGQTGFSPVTTQTPSPAVTDGVFRSTTTVPSSVARTVSIVSPARSSTRPTGSPFLTRSRTSTSGMK